MKPELRSVHSPDIDDVEGFVPADPERFGLLLQLMIGPKGLEGEESFDVVVCTAGWLRERAAETGIYSLRHHLLVDHYDWDGIRRFVETFLASIEDNSWRAAAERVGRLGRWEFEDYDA